MLETERQASPEWGSVAGTAAAAAVAVIAHVGPSEVTNQGSLLRQECSVPITGKADEGALRHNAADTDGLREEHAGLPLQLQAVGQLRGRAPREEGVAQSWVVQDVVVVGRQSQEVPHPLPLLDEGGGRGRDRTATLGNEALPECQGLGREVAILSHAGVRHQAGVFVIQGLHVCRGDECAGFISGKRGGAQRTKGRVQRTRGRAQRTRSRA